MKKGAVLLGVLGILGGCSDVPISNDDKIVTRDQIKYEGMGKFFGTDALLFGGSDQLQREPDVGIGVNTYLWKASLDTLAFMPLKSVDPFGGVILTDWYVPPKNQNERLKVDVHIMDRVLRADGIRVSVFREEFKGGRWVSALVNAKTAHEIEDAILTKARQLKIDSKR